MSRRDYYRATRTGHLQASGGARLRYSRFGTGPEVIVVIPGIDDAVQNLHALPWFWSWYFRPLAEPGRTVYLISRSRRLPESLKLEELAAIYAEVIERHIGRADVLGISMGGMIAQHLAVTRPDLVRRLILAVTAHRLADAGHEHGRKLMALASAGRWLAFVRLSNALCFSGALRWTVALALWLLAPIAFVLERRARRSSRGHRALDFCSSAHACAAHDAEAMLARIQAPTLIWGASADRLFPAEALTRMAGLLPSAQLVTVDGAHAAFLQNRRRFHRSVAEFLTAAPRAASESVARS
jgi:pimeloyl-ACP methyl ester carboxylesterase